MGRLKDHMIQEMKLKNFNDKTIESYTLSVQSLARYFNKSPLHLKNEDLKQYFAFLINTGMSPSTRHVAYYGIRFFYNIHNMNFVLEGIKAPKRPKLIPPVLDQSSIQDIFMNCHTLRYRTIFSLIYSSGLRISEALNLKVYDIDFERKVISINKSKNNKSRLTILSDKEIEILKKYITRYQPKDVLFYHPKDVSKPIRSEHVQKYFKKLISKCGLDKKFHVHTLRHSFATHLLENNVSIFYIMKLLGHSSITSTMIYLHMQRLDTLNIQSPLDLCSISLEKGVDFSKKQIPLLCA